MPVVTGAATFAVFYGAARVARRHRTLRRAIASVLRYADAGSTPLVVLIASSSGVAEELFFRGALWSGSRPLRTTTLAYAASTAATGNPALILAGLITSVIFGWQRAATGGVLAPAVTHVTWSVLMLRYLPPLFRDADRPRSRPDIPQGGVSQASPPRNRTVAVPPPAGLATSAYAGRHEGKVTVTGPATRDAMSTDVRRFPVTVTHLPVARCQVCHRTAPASPGRTCHRARPEDASGHTPRPVHGDSTHQEPPNGAPTVSLQEFACAAPNVAFCAEADDAGGNAELRSRP